MSLYRLLSIRYLFHRWDRAALIVASIALGVATLVSARILNAMVETATTQTTTPIGVGDLFVSNGELGVPRTVADDLDRAALAGVESVQPLVVERVTLPLLDRPAVLVGAELSAQLLREDNKLGVTVHATGAFNLFGGRLVSVSRPVYDAWQQIGAKKNDPFPVKYGTKQLDCVVVAVFDVADDSPLAGLGANVVGMELGQAARFLRTGPPPGTAAIAGNIAEAAWEAAFPPRVNRIDLYLTSAGKADRDTVRDAAQIVVGDRARVNTPEVQGQSTKEIVHGLQLGFLLCSAGAMVVGLFLVYNALAVTVAERRHDIGILRSVGATRPQIVVLFAVAAVVLGVVGATLGVPLGYGLARATVYQFRVELGTSFLNADVRAGWPTLGTIGLAVLAGVATAVLAAIVPSVQAAYAEPADAVRRVPGAVGGAWRTAHRAACAALVAGGVALIFTRHDLPPRVGAFGGMLAALVGLLLSAPIFVGLLVRLLHPVLCRVLPIEARLAADNLTRSPGRTGVVIGALGAGVAVMIQTAGVGKSNEEPFVAWLDQMIQADQYVFSDNLMSATWSQAPMEPRVVEEIRKVPGVNRATGLRFMHPDYNGTIVFLLALDCRTFADAVFARGAGPPDLEKYRHVAGKRVLVSENFAVRHGVRAGDVLKFPGANETIELTVVGTVVDFSWNRGTIIMDRSAYAKLFDDDRVDLCHIFYQNPDDPAARKGVAAVLSKDGLQSTDRNTLRTFLAELVNRMLVLAYLQQIVVGVVAALGVVTALLISVLQRKRELGLLLAVGATPAQVIRSVLAEALLMGLFGTVLGFLIGLPLQWYVLKVVLFEESGFLVEVLVPWKQAAGIAAGAVGVAALAGLLPALHAVRTRITDALAYE
jgi:putative ABC transport system permease protein